MLFKSSLARYLPGDTPGFIGEEVREPVVLFGMQRHARIQRLVLGMGECRTVLIGT